MKVCVVKSHRILAVAGILFLLSACGSSRAYKAAAPSESASCIEKQNYCLNICNENFKNAEFNNNLAGVLTTLTTKNYKNKAKNESMNNKMRENTKGFESARQECRTDCDTEQNQCMIRKR